MRLNKKLTVILAVITIVSFASAVLLEYSPIRDEVEFWINVLLGIFSGAFLTMITSIISYQYDKRKTLENFYCHTKQLLFFLSKYQEDMTTEEKLHFYINYSDFDKNAWGSDYGEIEFFFDHKHQKRNYIYNSIYTPLYDFDQAVKRCYWSFQWYLKGTNKNKLVIESFLNELQSYLLEKNETITSACQMKSSMPKLTRKIQQELDGRYYEIMYGRKTKKL